MNNSSMGNENVDSVKSDKFSILGIIFFIFGGAAGVFCLFEVVQCIIESNQIGLAFLSLLLLFVGFPGVILNSVSLVFNVLAYRYAPYKSSGKVAILVISIVMLLVSILSFIVWKLAVR